VPPGGRGEIAIRGPSRSPPTCRPVIAHCRAGLASFKVPRHVRFVTEWPMSSTKVQTFRLREQLEAELETRRMP
jgi:acyl-CoA synthetase (AMP-forming)/AMP-acid ligase II